MVVFDGYVRVSHVGKRSGPSFISPAVQREQIERWVAVQRAELGEVFEELDMPGAGVERPQLEEAIVRVEERVSDGLVVARLDRFGRSLLHGLTAIDRIQRAGGTFAAVNDGFDIRTDTGRFVMRVMLAMAEWQRDRIREDYEVARSRAIARGAHIGTVAPAGYVRTPSGHLAVDPVSGPAVTAAFAMRARGATGAEIAELLEARGALTGHGGRAWTGQTACCLLRRRVYLGEVCCGPHVNTSAHEPLTDVETWERCQLPRVTRRRREPKSPALLRGLLRCAGCQTRMRALTWGPAEAMQTRYRCTQRSAAGVCPAPALIDGAVIEPYLTTLALERAGDSEQCGHGALAARVDELTAARRALASYRDDARVQLELGPDGYAAGLRVRTQALHEAHRRLYALPPRRLLPSGRWAAPAWAALSVPQRREALSEIIDCAFVHRGHAPPGQRTWVCWAGQAPADLPRPGEPKRRLRGFVPPGGWAAASAERAHMTTVAGLEHELRAVIGDSRMFPSAAQLETAGHGDLLKQLQRLGGLRVWAARLDLPHHGERRHSPWSEAEVRTALETYLAGAATWPGRRTMQRDGLSSGLLQAISRTGGVTRWAAEFGLHRTRRRT